MPQLAPVNKPCRLHLILPLFLACVCVPLCPTRSTGGLLGLPAVSSLLGHVLGPYLDAGEQRVVAAYLAMMTPDKDGHVTPDELVQLLRVLPMRVRPPYLYDTPGIAAAVAAGGWEAAHARLGTGREVVFAAGFGGPVAADGSLPLIMPRADLQPGPGGGRQRYRRRLDRPMGPMDPAEAEEELFEELYGDPYDDDLAGVLGQDGTDYGNGLYAKGLIAAGRRRPGGRVGPGYLDGDGEGAGLAEQLQHDAARRAVGMAGHGLYDADQPELYGARSPYEDGQRDPLARGPKKPWEPRLGPQGRGKQRAGSSFVTRGSLRELDPLADAQGPTARLKGRLGKQGQGPGAAGAEPFDPYGLEGREEVPQGRVGLFGVGQEEGEAALLEQLRGRPPSQRPGTRKK